MRRLALLACVLAVTLASGAALQCAIDHRTDCGYLGINEAQCLNKGCCWQPNEGPEPWCYYGETTVPKYSVANFAHTEAGFKADLVLANGPAGSYGPALAQLRLTAAFETNERAHFRIVDPKNKRWEVPESMLPLPPVTRGAWTQQSSLFDVALARDGEAVTLTVTRRSDGAVIFDLAEFEYSNMFLQLGTRTHDPAPNLYGLGQHVQRLRLPTDNHVFTMHNVDVPTPWDQNEYGSHPFFLHARSDSAAAHGVFVRSSNSMDVVVSNDQVTFRIIGGVMDWYVFAGPTHDAVIRQYHAVIGLPSLPPYWSLGMHQCKYGWKNLSQVQGVVQAYKDNQIPLDTIWGDIDYMDAYEDFTWDPVHYPVDRVRQFADQLHADGQHYVVIVDPGIHNRTGYAAFDSGVEQRTFLTTDGVTPLIGQVWPGWTAFPDWFAPNTTQWWTQQISDFLSAVPYDGLWIDMNELSSFVDGKAIDPDHPVNSPPYDINNFGSHAPLNTKQLPMDAQHAGGALYFDTHNGYGAMEAIATRVALEKAQGKRPFILSRSTFPGIGAHAANWLGDNRPTWDDLYRSIAGVLSMNMFGVTMVGSDICGFMGPDTVTEELCVRWTALGAWGYTFVRNHHQGDDSSNQEPYRWPSVKRTAQKVLALRYALLPSLYTMLWRAHVSGGSVLKPLAFNYPTDDNTWSVDAQLMWNNSILVTPVLEQGQTSVTGYWPPSDVWYDLWTLAPFPVTGWREMACDWDQAILLHVRGGSVLAMQQPALTTAASRLTPFSLLVALDAAGAASGELFWDGGDDLQDGANNLILTFRADAAQQRSVTSKVEANTFRGDLPPLEVVFVAGMKAAPASVSLNGAKLPAQQWTYNQTTSLLTVSQLDQTLTSDFTLQWADASQPQPQPPHGPHRAERAIAGAVAEW